MELEEKMEGEGEEEEVGTITAYKARRLFYFDVTHATLKIEFIACCLRKGTLVYCVFFMVTVL